MKSCFTLAEVLITLGIVGVVATMTMPSLLANKQEKELITAWKKGYSDISNAALLMSQHQEDLTSEQKIGEAFAKYLKVDKVCEAKKAREQGCWKENTPVYKYDRSIHVSSIDDIAGGTTCMNLTNGGTFCIDTDDSSVPKVAMLYYDVNGVKKPNRVGVDIFAAVLNINTYVVKPAQGGHTNWGAADGTFVSLSKGDGTCGSDDIGYACSAEKLLK